MHTQDASRVATMRALTRARHEIREAERAPLGPAREILHSAGRRLHFAGTQLPSLAPGFEGLAARLCREGTRLQRHPLNAALINHSYGDARQAQRLLLNHDA